MNNPDSDTKDDELTLGLLGAIERRSDVSQRHLSQQLGIALGLTNSYLKRCARKGYVKIKEVPANRYLYYLTPKGFAEKSRLTARFLSTSLNFYRQSAESCSELFELCSTRDWKQLVLCGASDLAEIACMRAAGYTVSMIGVYDPRCKDQAFLSLPVWREWSQVKAADAYIVTSLKDPLKTYWEVQGEIQDSERLLVPRVLGLDAAIKTR